MAGALYRVTTLLLAVAILLIGHGLQLTLLPMRASALGWSPFTIGATGSLYFLGFVVGCIGNPQIVARVGHIRTFMVMAAIATIALLCAGLFVSWQAWFLLRFASGFALAGLYMVIESWLNEVSPRESRGTILALYTAISLVGMAVGQSLMGLGTPRGLDLFGVGAVFLCLAILPIGLTTVSSPQPVPALRFKPDILLRASRVAVIGAFTAGLVTGAFWTLGPVLAGALGLETGATALLMGAFIIGGAAAQLPAGRLSDLTDRRFVIAGLAGLGAVAALIGWLLAATFSTGATGLVYVVFFCIGAATLPLYALCIAHASDEGSVPLVELASGTLMVHSMGSIVGPLVVAALMGRLGVAAYFGYIFVCLIVTAAWTLVRSLTVERPHVHEAHAFMLPKTTHAVVGLEPAGASEAEPASAGSSPESRSTAQPASGAASGLGSAAGSPPAAGGRPEAGD